MEEAIDLVTVSDGSIGNHMINNVSEAAFSVSEFFFHSLKSKELLGAERADEGCFLHS
jgi:hypothetical protein